MDSLRYTFITDRDLEKCEKLRARGLMLPSLAFALSPHFCSDGSAEFTLSMFVPAVLWTGFAVTVAVVWIVAGGGPSQYPEWFLSLIFGLLVVAAYTYRLWRSVRVWPDGRTQISEPRPFGRRVIEGEAGDVRLLIGLSYSRTDRVKTSFGMVPQALMLHVGKPIYHSQPCLLISAKGTTFVLAREDRARLTTLAELLTQDYSLRLERSPVLCRYRGFIM